MRKKDLIKISTSCLFLIVLALLTAAPANAEVVREVDTEHTEYIDSDGCLNIFDELERQTTITNPELRNYHAEERWFTRVFCYGSGEDFIEPRIQHEKTIKRIDYSDKIDSYQDIEINILPGFGMARVQNYRVMEMGSGLIHELEVEVERL